MTNNNLKVAAGMALIRLQDSYEMQKNFTEKMDAILSKMNFEFATREAKVNIGILTDAERDFLMKNIKLIQESIEDCVHIISVEFKENKFLVKFDF